MYTGFWSPIFRLELSQNSIENKVYYDLATTFYFSNTERKQIGWPEVIGVEVDKSWPEVDKWSSEGPSPPIEMPPMIKMMKTKSIVCSISVFFSIFA